MKKQTILSLLILNPIFVYAMENNGQPLTIFSSCIPAWFSSSQKPHESKFISDLRESKSKFEKELENWYQKDFGNFAHSIFCYCYFPQSTIPFVTNLTCLDYLDSSPSKALEIYQSIHRIGYSALGATIIAKRSYYNQRDISFEAKRHFIQELTKRGFQPTPKDIKLAELVLYDEITKHKKTILHLLCTSLKANWSVLPQECKTLIAWHMIQLFKNDFQLLPKTLSNKF